MIRIGFIGCGSISHTHVMRLSLLQDGEAEIVGLCDVNLENAKRLSKLVKKFRNISPRFPHEPSIFKEPVKMLETLDLDAVIVCTPHTLHYRHVMAALERNLHVLVEKPMAVNLKEVIEMRDEAESRGLRA